MFVGGRIDQMGGDSHLAAKRILIETHHGDETQHVAENDRDKLVSRIAGSRIGSPPGWIPIGAQQAAQYYTDWTEVATGVNKLHVQHVHVPFKAIAALHRVVALDNHRKSSCGSIFQPR
jgi:hypothetical protein